MKGGIFGGIRSIPQNHDGWTTELLDWADPSHQRIQRKLNPPVAWHFMGDTTRSTQGRLIGGCLEVLQFLTGTPLWPNLSTWKNSILFLETSEEGIEPHLVTRFMRNLAAQGILQHLNGMLFSKPGGKNIHVEQYSTYEKALVQVFEEFSIPLIPFVTRMDFGHSDPMWTLPYGILTEINPFAKTVSILDNAVD